MSSLEKQIDFVTNQLEILRQDPTIDEVKLHRDAPAVDYRFVPHEVRFPLPSFRRDQNGKSRGPVAVAIGAKPLQSFDNLQGSDEFFDKYGGQSPSALAYVGRSGLLAFIHTPKETTGRYSNKGPRNHVGALLQVVAMRFNGVEKLAEVDTLLSPDQNKLLIGRSAVSGGDEFLEDIVISREHLTAEAYWAGSSVTDHSSNGTCIFVGHDLGKD